nr:hypothetical protein GCM10020093_096920 [Planobispora longispora]
MLHRLAADYPDARLACLRLEPMAQGASELWYPAFARSPVCRDHPIPGDDLEYEPYLRYAYDSGTATGMSEPEALLHGLLEAVERDALSHALLNWYVNDTYRPSGVDPADLPADISRLYEYATDRFGGPPLLIDMTSDLEIPAYCALPPRARHPGVLGSGASLDAEYALERALTEVVQSEFNMSLGVDRTLGNRLAYLRRWPLLERCARADPAGLADRLSRGGDCPDGRSGRGTGRAAAARRGPGEAGAGRFHGVLLPVESQRPRFPGGDGGGPGPGHVRDGAQRRTGAADREGRPAARRSPVKR